MGYLEEHKKSGLKVGDKVKIIREAEDYENGWENGWSVEMDVHVGEIGEIVGDHSTLGFDVKFNCDSVAWCFPYFILKKIEPKYETIMYIEKGEWVTKKRIIGN